ncbi:hypothetical protein DUNSADRAFT_6966 [Dunaliella salina]|uniref:Encoded protein n=1 Tax=Dunaliella salina TaxID=3046 RepID=A0ABQ7GMA1_DUNSA|nr:hypothetical protein DUNSADRAFT_6966 [Dunaliella salina]|eukprot:KAF5835740.1 hypothetical protein DUNSADRAFT_6966 [Dunaliella salina]
MRALTLPGHQASSCTSVRGPLRSMVHPRAMPPVSAVAPHTEAVVEVHCAKDRCVHPGRSAKELCKDCPRRKQRKSTMASAEDVAYLEGILAAPCAVLGADAGVTTAAKGKKCIHPMRPLQGACRDCPRRKGLRGMIGEEVQQPAFTILQ